MALRGPPPNSERASRGGHAYPRRAFVRAVVMGVIEMLRRVVSAVALTGLVLVAATGAVSANAPATEFKAHLTGDQEVPPTGSTGTGTLTLKLTDNDTRLHFRLRADGV